MSEQYPGQPDPNAPQTPPQAPQYGAPQYGAPQYGSPQYGDAPQQPYGQGGMSPSDENTWVALGHFGGILLGFIAPLIVMLVKGGESPRVRAQAVESLNFQITAMIAFVVSAILTIILIGLLMMIAVGIGVLVLCILAGVKALNGEDYRYPMTLRLVK